jgi:hypothetical protein
MPSRRGTLEAGEGMTAPMIEWTLEVLDWIRPQLWKSWPEAEMRGSAPDLEMDGYRIRFRDGGRQFWLVFSPEVIQLSSVSEVQSLLEAADWIRLLRKSGGLSVGVHEDPRQGPSLNPIDTLELKTRAS